MATLDPKFNSWALSNAGFVDAAVSLTEELRIRPEKSSQGDHGASSESLSGGLRIRLVGTIADTTGDGARDKLELLRKNTRGTDYIKKGRLDLYSDGHYYCQRVGIFPGSVLPPSSKIQVAVEFFADDPFRRADTIKTVQGTPATTLTITFASDFDGSAPRIPLLINVGDSWAQGEFLRIENTTVGWKFEHEVTQTLSSSEDLVVDGEVCDVLEGSSVVGEGTTGTFPYIRGGVTNTLDFVGSDNLNLTTINFFDRF